MKQILQKTKEHIQSSNFPISQLSFRPLYNFLQKKIASEKTLKAHLYNLLIKKIEEHPELAEPINIEQVGKYSELLEIIYAVITGIKTEDEEILWGLGMPGTADVFYGTDTLYDLVANKISRDYSDVITNHTDKNETRHLSFIYSVILERFYGYTTLLKQEMVLSFTRKDTGLLQYYKAEVDTSFIEVRNSNPLPKLDFGTIESHSYDGSLVEYLKEILPLQSFTFTGFTVCRIHDVTAEKVVGNIKNIIINSSTKPKETCIGEAMQSLKTLLGSTAINFGFVPFIRLNSEPLLEFGELSNSLILNYGRNGLIDKATFLSIIESFIQKPRPLFFEDIEATTASSAFTAILKKSGNASFAVLPLFYNNELTGSLEIYTKEKGLLTDKVLSKLDIALPHLARLMKTSIEDFNTKIAATINEKFTALQPSVQWKFNEAAWRYMQAKFIGKRDAEMETISFKNVYPLYGSIDIRNSSVERNIALCEDLRFQLSLIVTTLETLNQRQPLALIHEMIFKCNKTLLKLDEHFVSSDAYKINDFIERDIIPFLRHFKETNNDVADIIDAYFVTLDQEKGLAHENRRNLETSMQMINKAINHYLELMKDDFQQSYPCYFEKFRTDGVEYDIYIGQSIMPNKTFDLVYLKNLRLNQLTSMAAIYKLTNALLPQMPKQLQTTQLIFINGEPIDISFRNDEKRFDVEGAYNIRYQMVKKRIDKVHIKNTNERLTQVGKIAMVYFHKKDAEEYVAYINYLQEQKLLLNDLEYLELEELQGISGLKALRVGVNVAEENT